MCLGVPGKVIAIEGRAATVDFWGVQRTVYLDIVDEPVSPGDYILNHVGFALRRIPQSEVAATLELYEEIMRVAAPDLLASEVADELGGHETSSPGGEGTDE